MFYREKEQRGPTFRPQEKPGVMSRLSFYQPDREIVRVLF